MEIAAVSDGGVSSLTRSTPAVVNTEATDGFDDVPHCRVGLPQWNRESESPWVSPQLRTKIIYNRKEKVKSILGRRSSFLDGGMNVEVHHSQRTSFAHRRHCNREPAQPEFQGKGSKSIATPCPGEKLVPKGAQTDPFEDENSRPLDG